MIRSGVAAGAETKSSATSENKLAVVVNFHRPATPRPKKKMSWASDAKAATALWKIDREALRQMFALGRKYVSYYRHKWTVHII